MTFQISAGLMDACVLAILSREETYGYMLTQKGKDVMGVSESTLYPVLRRLEKEGLLTTRDKEFQGRNRRYYCITKQGTVKLSKYLEDWETYKFVIDKVLYGGEGFE